MIGGLTGLLITEIAEPFILFVAVAGIFVCIGTIARIEGGLLALVFMTYTRFSDVLVKYHGAPSVAKSFVVLLIVAIIVRWRLYGEKPRGWERSTFLVVSFGLVIATSLFYAVDFTQTSSGLITFIKDAIIAIVIATLVQNANSLRRVIWMLLAAGIFMGTISVYQQLTGTHTNNYWGFGQAEIRQIVGDVNDFRISGPIGDSNIYGQVLVVLVPIALDRVWNEKKGLLRFLAIWALAVCTLSIMFTFSRGGFLALAGVLGLMLVRRPPSPPAILATVVAIILIMQFVPARYTDRIRTLLEFAPNEEGATTVEDGSFKGRSSEMTAAWMMFIDHPFLGVGLDNSPLYYPQYSILLGIDPNRETRSAHSLYLEIAAETGLLGLSVFGMLLWFMFRGLWQAQKDFAACKKHDEASLTLALNIGLIGYMTAAMFLHNAYPRYFWLLFGIAIATAQVAQRELDISRDVNPDLRIV